jgi:hypothetical protein
MHGVVQACACASSGQTLTMVQAAIGTRSTSEIYRDRKQLAATICAKACIRPPRGLNQDLVDVVRRECKCYAGHLGTLRPAHAGYADQFEAPKRFPGRMAAAAKWGPPTPAETAGKPWLAGLPRLIFISDNVSDRLISLGHKRLLPKEATAALALVEGRAHALVESCSFPFLNGLAHFLPNTKLEEVTAKLKGLEEEFWKAKAEFIQRYARLIVGPEAFDGD